MSSSFLGRWHPAGCAVAVLLTWTLPAPAADAGAQAPAADPSALGAPPAHAPLRPRLLPNAQPTDAGWRAAHTAVGAFPRGHADIVAWEARQAGTAEPAQADAAPRPTRPHGHHGHGGPAMPAAGSHGHTPTPGGAR